MVIPTLKRGRMWETIRPPLEAKKPTNTKHRKDSMSKQLKISDDLSLPIDAATQTFAFIARKGAGKTYAAGKLAECLIDAGVQVVVLDSVGNWFGLRLSADGKEAGYDIPVIGGLRGDIPLEATGGKLIADTIVETGRSLIVDVSQFSKHDRQRFATEFGERLWSKKKAEHHPSPLHLIIEESQLIVPEAVRGDSARMVGIYEEIIRLGRNYGIGASMISQRPQSVNKEVLNQTECLFALQVNGAHERKALMAWITHQGLEKSLVDELPSLPIGTAYVWSPQWLQILKKIRIGQKKTFDASATPKVGSQQVRRDLKPLQLDDLQDRMAATIEKAKAEDPKELRKQIADLRRQLSQNAPDPKAIETAVNRAVADAEKRFEATQRKNAQAIKDLTGRLGQIANLSSLNGNAPALAEYKPVAPTVISNPRPALTRAPTPTKPTAHVDDQSLTGPEQRILDAIAWLEDLGITEPNQVAVAFLAGYTFGGGGFNNPRGALRTKGLVDYVESGKIKLTKEGRERAKFPDEDEKLDSETLQKRVLERLPGPEQRILRVLLDSYPDALSKEECAGRAGYTFGSGGFNNPCGRLRSLGIAEYPSRGDIKASRVLFLEA